MMEDEEAQVVVMFDHATPAASGTTRLQSSEEDEGRGAEDRLSPESDDLDLDDGARMLRRATGPNPSSSGAVGAAVNIDSKSQNSDYGSFCNTPNCDTVTTGGATSTGAAK